MKGDALDFLADVDPYEVRLSWLIQTPCIRTSCTTPQHFRYIHVSYHTMLLVAAVGFADSTCIYVSLHTMLLTASYLGCAACVHSIHRERARCVNMSTTLRCTTWLCWGSR